MRRLGLSVVVAGLLALLSGGSAAVAHTSALTINRNATLSPGKTLITVRGTVTCTVGETFAIDVAVFQGNGQNQNEAFGPSFFPFPPPPGQACTGSPQSWRVTAESFTGPFHAGKATARACSQTFPDGARTCVDRVIHLRS